VFLIDDFFSGMQFEVMDKLVFSHASISLKDVLTILEPKYTKEKELNGVKDMQTYFFEKSLPDILRKGEEKERRKGENNFLLSFVQFCTGSCYLPDPAGHPDFKINVEFSMSIDHNALPTAHTCSNDLVLPALLYNSDLDKFAAKLDDSLKTVKQFNMP